MVNRPSIIKASIRGASHHRNGLPNQDDISVFQSNELSIIAVADGHGSAKYTHSHLGSKFATVVAINILKKLFSNTKNLTLSQIKHLAEERVPVTITRCWQDKINAYIEDMGKSQSFRYSNKNLFKVENEFLFFGTTLLVTLVLPQCTVYWQIGDGDIIILNTNKQLNRPIPIDKRLLGNETTSLCNEKPWFDFQCCFQPNNRPQLIMLASDGYSNSFVDNENFEQAVADIAHLIETEGEIWVNANLHDWLQEASEKGSGDDISIGLISFI